MDIGFVWDIDKYEEVQRRHDVQFYEVVSAFDDPHGYYISDPQGHADRCMLVASTFNGRILSIIYSDEDAPLNRLITAYDAEQRFINEYDRRSRI